ncbi:F0F1 ATP synthase subunit B family protein [Granulicella tundricola]|uniref:H+transporting two-sector ATPase B/B' subunit n=1 Tax=Granulicella tundricola (strain ATCC BAA-1859 / DSM 23138 / MP5ACTX9) TaxID=1198114 RepID=E8X3M2_GRATM|nr:ATP synthase F0 subunit B [Granulicella tundricola]ADW68213.1 H+transporting two-sector ATPase B/B' subunit [Granulicella tundricola MP5ACTX9]
MNEILNQLGALILGSIPTMVLFIVLVIAYGVLVRRPLENILAKRRALTTGALEQAKGAMSAAEAETVVFEDKLRGAKSEIFQAREAKLKEWNGQREQSLAQARTVTQERVAAAKGEIERSMAEAMQQIETMSGELSASIIKAVLPAGVNGAEVAQ